MPTGEHVTVVIPTIPPRADLLDRALASVATQTVTPAQVIVVTDTDHAGAAVTRTRGLMQVTTDWVAFLDDDDELEPHHLAALLAEQEATGADVVYPWFTVVGGTDPIGWENRPFDAAAMRAFDLHPPVTLLARTKLVQDVGGFDADNPHRCDEWGAWIKMLDAGATFTHLPARTWRWHHHAGNTAGRGDRWKDHPPVKLNLGCGDFPAVGWLNIDSHHPAADLQLDLRGGLPDVDGPIERLYAGHVLEHLPMTELPAILRRWRRHPAVSVDTRMAVVGPDCERGERQLAEGRLTAEDLALMRKGAERWTGDTHLWDATEARTLALLWASGWTAEPTHLSSLALDGWPLTSQVDWQFAILARPRMEGTPR